MMSKYDRVASPDSVILKTPSELLIETGTYEFPIDPIRIANSYGIPVYVMNFDNDDISGVLEFHANAPRILVNKHHSTTRKRFTVAHELGHFFRGHLQLDDDQQIIDDQKIFRSGAWDRQEQEANAFAADLLMPAQELKEMVMSGKSFKDLVKIFGVSEQAMYVRLSKLHII